MAGRRVAVYFAWSRPDEFAAPPGVELFTPLGVLENRYPTLFEFRRAVWPAFEHLKDPARFNQSIAGFFDHIILPDFDLFRAVVKEATGGNEVAVIQRQTDAPPPRQLDDGLFKDLDTLIVVSLDHDRTGQTASPGEVDAIRTFLGREGRCVVVCPHHDIGAADALDAQRVEYTHHGDGTIPARQRLGGFARSVLAGLGVPVTNAFGLNPAVEADGTPAPLVIDRDSSAVTLLEGVTTFNRHPHLPHLSVPPEFRGRVEVLARQPINPQAPRHPFTDAGNRYFDALLRVRPDGVAGTVLVGDATLWSSAFGGVASLRSFWRNLAGLPL